MTPVWRIGLDDLKIALRHGGMIDASQRVLNIGDREIVRSTVATGAHRPPFLLAAHEFEGFEELEADRSWGFRNFERLSLAARTSLTLNGLSLRSRAAPQSAVDNKAKRLREAAVAADIDLDGFPVVDPEDILAALAWVADELGPDQGSSGSAATAEQLAMRGGLQLVGCRIRPTRPGRGRDGLRLINARLPVSLRLIGCVLECPLLLSHCELVSLDLSGSAMHTLDATGIKTSGSVHLRRAMICTPVSFAGARVAGSFNASDAVFAPFAPASTLTPVDPDHGILNLSRATIENEVRLERARVWGGMSLRGATIGRSLFLNDALLMAPVALMEKWLGDLLNGVRFVHQHRPAYPAGIAKAINTALPLSGSTLRRMASADRWMAKRLHSRGPPTPRPATPPAPAAAAAPPSEAAKARARIRHLVELEILDGETDRWRWLAQRTLLKLRMRAMNAALRADGLKVDGSIFARRILATGLVRMKYAEIAGSVRMEGSLLRSAQACRTDIETAIEALRGVTAFEQLEIAEALAAGHSPADRGDSKKIDFAFLAGLGADGILRALEQLRIRAKKSLLEECRRHLDAAGPTWRFHAAWDDLLSRGDSAGAHNLSGSQSRRDLARKAFDAEWARENASVALDMRETRLQGDLSLGSSATLPRDRGTLALVRSAEMPSDVHGDLLFGGMKAAGSILLIGLRMHVQPRTADPARPGRQGPNQAPEPPGDLPGLFRWFELRFRALGAPAAAPAIPPSFVGWLKAHGKRRLKVVARVADRLLTAASFNGEGQIDYQQQSRRRAQLARARSVTTIDMAQVVVGREVDLRDSRSVEGVTLENAEIGGDLKFSDKTKASDALQEREIKPADDYSPGFIPCSMRAVRLAGALNLRSVRIKGDAVLIFDPRRGPSIKAEMATISGRLEIYPQIDTLSYQVIDRSHRPRSPGPGGFWLDDCDHKAERRERGHPALEEDDSPGIYCTRCNLLLDKVNDATSWDIDLRHAKSTFFAHPPAAWPDPGALSLDGFDYQQSSDLGPLVPAAPMEKTPAEARERRRRRFVWRHHHTRRLLLGVGGALATLGLWFGVSIGGWLALDAWTRQWTPWIMAPALSWICTILVSMIVLFVPLLFIKPGFTFWLRWPFTRDHRVRPRAIEYLRRQRVTENRFKARPAAYHVLDSYVRAAKALREGGRYISANIVEEERLRRRTEMLSWRHHGPAKAALVLVDAFAGYGFRLWRAFFILTASICVVAAVAHTAAANGYLERVETWTVDSGALAHAADDRPVCGTGRAGGVMDQDCPDFIYAADILLPFADFGEADRWKPTIPPRPKHEPTSGPDAKGIRRLVEPFESTLASILYCWPSLVGVFGLLMTAIFGAAAAARVESAFARVEE